MISAHANVAALEVLLRLHNELSDWFIRSYLSDAIETIAGRLGLTVHSTGAAFQLVPQ